MSSNLEPYFKRIKTCGQRAWKTAPAKVDEDTNSTPIHGNISGDPMDIDRPVSSLTDNSASREPHSVFSVSNQSSLPYTRAPESVSSMETRRLTRGLDSSAIFPLLPKIMSFLRWDDLTNLMLAHRHFYDEGMRMLYRNVSWDLQDPLSNKVIVRLMAKHKSSETLKCIKPPIAYVRSLYLQVSSPPVAYEHETDIRLGLLLEALPQMKLLKSLTISDCREAREIQKYGFISRMSTYMEEILWGDGTRNLETFEILIERDLTFFTSLLKDENPSLPNSPDRPARLKAPSYPPNRRKPTIKHFTLRSAYAMDFYNTAICTFEYQLAYLLLVLSPYLTHLTLIGLPKPLYLASPQDVGTGTWGGSVGKVFEILGTRALRSLQELTIEAADTRYEVAEGAISSWVAERSIYAKSLTEEELRRKGLKAQEQDMLHTDPVDDNNTTVQCPLSNELRWSLFERYHHEDYECVDELHLNCDSNCEIHGTTSGTFAPAPSHTKPIPHQNPLLRLQPPQRKLKHLHFINCPEPWPAFYTIACLHPPSTMHFSSPWMDSSSTDVPDSLRALGIDTGKFAISPELRKSYGGWPTFPRFNQGSFTIGIDYSDRVQAWPRPTGANRLHGRRIRKKMQHYMSMLQDVPLEPLSKSSPSLAQVMAMNMKRVEVRTLERVSMKLVQSIVSWYGESLEVLGLSRLDGSYREASATGHVRGWGKILGRCSRLKELRIVWNLFDDVDWEQEAISSPGMKFGIGERRLGGVEALVAFSEQEWWGNTIKVGKGGGEAAENDDSSSDLDNGEGPSTQRPTIETTSEATPATVSAEKSSEPREDYAKSGEAEMPYRGPPPAMWVEKWQEWPDIKRYFPPANSNSSYITEHGAQYLMRQPSDKHPTLWTRHQMKELLLFLMEWKFRKLGEAKSENTALDVVQEGVAQTSDQALPSKNPATSGVISVPSSSHGTPFQQTFSSVSTSSPGRWSSSFRIFHESSPTPSKVFPIYVKDMAYPFVSMNQHNVQVFLDRLNEEYSSREKILASTIWDVIDASIVEGKKVETKGWKDRFLVTSEVSLARGGFKLPPGIIFTKEKYQDDGNHGKNYQEEQQGPWVNALNELLSEEPSVFNIGTHDKARADDHQFISNQLRAFFKEINLWQRKLRLEATLGNGLKRFCGLSWVMFEEVPTLETVVGLLENGTEVAAHCVRHYEGTKSVVEIVKIRCWNCGGGWAGDYKNFNKPSGQVPIRIRAGGRECRCILPSIGTADLPSNDA